MPDKVTVNVNSHSAAEAYRVAYTRAHANGYEWTFRELESAKKRCSPFEDQGKPCPDEWLASLSAYELAMREISGGHPKADIEIRLNLNGHE